MRDRGTSAGGREVPPRDEMQAVGAGGESLGNLVTGIVEDLQNIVRGEVQLAKTELKEDAGKIGKGAGMLAGGALVGLVGFIFLMLALTYLLNKSLELWISAGIVGLALAVIAAVLAMVGKGQLSAASLMPEQTIESVKEDQEWANRQIKSVKR